jgi:hypothetical protein
LPGTMNAAPAARVMTSSTSRCNFLTIFHPHLLIIWMTTQQRA